MKATNDAVKTISPETKTLQAAGISTAEDVYKAIASGADGTGGTSGIVCAKDPVATLKEMIAALDKKNTAERKPTAKQTENEAVRAALVEFINANFEGDGFTCGDLLKVCPAVEGRSNQYVSAILSQAFKAGEVSKGSVKRRTYFAPVGVYETPAEDAE